MGEVNKFLNTIDEAIKNGDTLLATFKTNLFSIQNTYEISGMSYDNYTATLVCTDSTNIVLNNLDHIIYDEDEEEFVLQRDNECILICFIDAA